jgi:hypothetical protein
MHADLEFAFQEPPLFSPYHNTAYPSTHSYHHHPASNGNVAAHPSPTGGVQSYCSDPAMRTSFSGPLLVSGDIKHAMEEAADSENGGCWNDSDGIGYTPGRRGSM